MYIDGLIQKGLTRFFYFTREGKNLIKSVNTTNILIQFKKKRHILYLI